jgi:hypothetical protein
MSSKQFISDTSKQRRLYKNICIMLGALWTISIVLVVCMFLYSQQPENAAYKDQRKLSLDDMLLSFNELKLGNNTTLINLQLKEVSQKNTDFITDKAIIADDRKKIYDKILEHKIKTPPPVKQGGFMIKPVPE